VRVLAFFVAGLFLTQGLSAGLAKSGTPGAELSFTVGSGSIDYSAVCVGSASAVRQARRMTGLFPYLSARWSPDGAMLAADVWRTGDNAIRFLRADGLRPGGLHVHWPTSGTPCRLGHPTGTRSRSSASSERGPESG
jgi:hypothetical protein